MMSNNPAYQIAENNPNFASERQTGYPNPHLYDQYYINKYSFPKGLQAIQKSEEERRRRYKKSLYDIR